MSPPCTGSLEATKHKNPEGQAGEIARIRTTSPRLGPGRRKWIAVTLLYFPALARGALTFSRTQAFPPARVRSTATEKRGHNERLAGGAPPLCDLYAGLRLDCVEDRADVDDLRQRADLKPADGALSQRPLSIARSSRATWPGRWNPSVPLECVRLRSAAYRHRPVRPPRQPHRPPRAAAAPCRTTEPTSARSSAWVPLLLTAGTALVLATTRRRRTWLRQPRTVGRSRPQWSPVTLRAHPDCHHRVMFHRAGGHNRDVAPL